MAKRWETIRVFISSTFRDMHAERDYLVKVVFPKLRERLEAYQYHLEDIDLRWGVTANQADNDMALDLCLQQIDECRPFFVGILGERYGHVPKSFTDEAVSKYGWIQHQTGKSLTELEILYGVLRKKEMEGLAFFYFRDKVFIKDVPAWKQADILSEDEKSAGKLNVLKDAIRQSDPAVPCLDGYPCKYAGLKVNSRILKLEVNDNDWETLKDVIKGGFVELERYNQLDDNLKEVIRRNAIVYLDELKTFGDRVYDQLWRAIKAEHSLPDTPSTDTLAQDDPLAYKAQFHERFIESRTRIYIGREKIQQELMDYVNGDDIVPCLVTGPSGSGKSAALARFAQTLELQNDDKLLIPHFVGTSPASTSLRQMLRRFCEILTGRFHYEDDIPFDINKLVDCFRKFTADVPEDTHVVILIDALNQMDETDNAHSMNWLPTKLPGHVKIVVSCIDDPDNEEKVPQAFEHRQYHHIKVEPLTINERLEIVRQVPSLSAKTLDPKQVGLLLDNKATDNPLFLLVALEELRGFGSFEHLSDRIRQLPRGQNANIEIFAQVIERLTDEFDGKVVEDVLCYLACSRNGMTERELLELNEGIGTEESESDLSSVLRQLRPYLQYHSDSIDFFHRGLFKAVRKECLDTDDKTQAIHSKLAEYFRKKADPDGDSTWRSNYPHGISELPYHLSKCGDREGYEDILLDYCFMQTKLDVFGVHMLIEDYTLSEAERNTPLDLACKTLDLSRTALALDRNQLPGQLLGRLLRQGDQRIQELVSQTKRSQHGPWLRPLFASLTPPGGPLIRRLEGHTDWVTFCSATSDGRVVSASNDHTLKVWDLGTGECLRTLKGHTGRVTSLLLTSDGHVVSASNDHTLKVWDLESGECLRTLKGHRHVVFSLLLTSDGRVVSSSHDRTLKVWDLETGECLRTLEGHTSGVTSLWLTSDGRVVSSEGHTLKVWDIESGQCLKTLEGHMNQFTSLSLTSDGCVVSAGSYYDNDSAFRVWDLETGQCLRSFAGHSGGVSCLLLISDGRVVSAGGTDGTLKVWDLASGECLRTLEGHTSGVTSLLLTSDRRVVSTSDDHTLKVWDLGTGECLKTLEGLTGSVCCLSLTCEDHVISSGGSYSDHTLKVWDLSSGECLKTRGNQEGWANTLSLTSDGRVVSASEDDTLKVWDLGTAECLKTLEGHTGSVQCFSLTSDGRLVSSEGNSLKVWDLESGQCLKTLEGHTSFVTSFSLTSDGRIVSASDDHTLKVWDLESGQCLRTLEGHTRHVNCLSLTADGRVVSGSLDKTLKVWDLESGQCLRTLDSHIGSIKCLSLTSEGHVVSAGGHAVPPGVYVPPWGDIWDDHALKVWDLESGERLRTLEGHTDVVYCLSLTSDGRAVSGSWDHTLKVWDIKSGLEIASFSGESGIIRCAVKKGSDGLILDGSVQTNLEDDDESIIVALEESGRVHFLKLEEPQKTKQ